MMCVAYKLSIRHTIYIMVMKTTTNTGKNQKFNRTVGEEIV